MDRKLSTARTTAQIVAFETTLAILALAVSGILGHCPAHGIFPSQTDGVPWIPAIVCGSAAALPMVCMALLIEQLPCSAFCKLRHCIYTFVMPIFAGMTILQLATVSLAAGVGEELLFRGLLQSGISQAIGHPAGPWLGLTIAAIAFGVAHWITPLYATLATLVGVYLGGLLWWTDNILAPVAAHAVYDFLILVYLVRRFHAGSGKTEGISAKK